MITQKYLNKKTEWFDFYICELLRQYPQFKENLELKANHSRKVSEEIVGIAESLNLSEEETLLAKTIGLFHDIGRFKQYVKYQTFSDSKSQNHAELGVEVLKEYEVLNGLSEHTQDIIYKSIINHSRAEIISDTDEKVIFFSKLIRDADKLDIWRLITEYYMVKEAQTAGAENKSIELELPDTEGVSDPVYHSILNKQIVLKETMKTLNDFKLVQIGWLFDLNFSFSIHRLFEKKYLEKIFETLPNNERIGKLREIVEEYFEEHIETYII